MSKKKVLALTASAILSTTSFSVHAATAMTQQEMQQFMQQVNNHMTQMQKQMVGLQNEVSQLKSQLKVAKAANKTNVLVVNKVVPEPTVHPAYRPVSEPVPAGYHALPPPGYNEVPVTPEMNPYHLEPLQHRASTGATLQSSTSTVPTVPITPIDVLSITGIPVFTSPYLGKDRAFDGSDLVINQSSVNLNVQLLKQEQVLGNMFMEAGLPVPEQPLLELSGKVEAQGIVNMLREGNTHSQLSLSSTELDAFAIINPWTSGFMDINFDNSSAPPIPNPEFNSRLFVRQGFITIGRLNVCPLFASAGQLFVPFGQYGSYMINSPFTQLLGRVQQRALEVGFRPASGLYGAGYIYNSNTEVDGGAGYGLDVGITHSFGSNDANIAVDVINNLAESQGMQSNSAPSNVGFGGFAENSNAEKLAHGVPGFDVHGSADIGNWSLMAEYLTATRSFSKQDLTFNNEGAHPQAFHGEIAYHLTLCSKPTSIALSYDQTMEALALLIPKSAINGVINISPWRDTVASLQLSYLTNYGSHDVATGAGSTPFGPTFRDGGMVTAQFGVYF